MSRPTKGANPPTLRQEAQHDLPAEEPGGAGDGGQAGQAGCSALKAPVR